jgi:hypothetical protein
MEFDAHAIVERSVLCMSTEAFQVGDFDVGSVTKTRVP